MRKVINFQLVITFVFLILISFCCIGYTAEEILTWDNTFGGIEVDMANSIIQTEDGGYALAGYTWSKGAGRQDFWVIKLYEDGSIEWDRTFGGSEADVIYSIIQTKDKGYAVAGKTKSIASGEKAWAIKLNTKGNKEWDNTFAKRTDDEIFSIIQTKDRGYAVCGYTESKGSGGYDAWIAKLDENGEIVWDKAFGGVEAEVANSIIQTRDGGYALAGYTWSKGAGREDAWMIKLDEKGNLE
jgi:hypothetical protein